MTELRPERSADLAGIRAVHTAAFDTPAEADLVDALRSTDAITGAWSCSGEAWQVLPPSTGTPPGEALHPAP